MCDHELKSFVKITTNTNSDGHSPRSLSVVDGHMLVDCDDDDSLDDDSDYVAVVQDNLVTCR